MKSRPPKYTSNIYLVFSAPSEALLCSDEKDYLNAKKAKYKGSKEMEPQIIYISEEDFIPGTQQLKNPNDPKFDALKNAGASPKISHEGHCGAGDEFLYSDLGAYYSQRPNKRFGLRLAPAKFSVERIANLIRLAPQPKIPAAGSDGLTLSIEACEAGLDAVSDKGSSYKNLSFGKKLAQELAFPTDPKAKPYHCTITAPKTIISIGSSGKKYYSALGTAAVRSMQPFLAIPAILLPLKIVALCFAPVLFIGSLVESFFTGIRSGFKNFFAAPTKKRGDGKVVIHPPTAPLPRPLRGSTTQRLMSDFPHDPKQSSSSQALTVAARTKTLIAHAKPPISHTKEIELTTRLGPRFAG